MATIRVISTSIIQARSHNNGDLTQKIELNPWDLQFLLVETIQKGLLFHKPRSKDRETLIQHLRDSLSSTLDSFLQLAGRLAVVDHSDGTSSVFIACNNAGASFVHATAENNITVADILEPIYIPPIVHSFFPLNGAKNFEGTSQPLLAVQVTELVDSIFIGCSMNHCVVEGALFWNFFNAWAEISRGGLDNEVSKPPSLERWFLDGIERPIRIPFSAEENQQEDTDGSILTPLPERIFHFSREKIAELKAKANSQINNVVTNKISSLQAVLSHIWRSVIRNQSLDPEEEVTYKLLISARPRIRPPIPENYFGNALQFGSVTMKAGEVLDDHEGLGKVAWELNKLISLHTDEKFKRDFECWVKNPRLPRLSGIAGSKSLGTSSSPRFNFYGNDFGWGRPVAIRSGAANKRYGKLTVYGGAEEGSMDIELCISYEILEAMGRDPEFMEAVSNYNG